MVIWVLDTNFDTVSVIDEYMSFIWTDRYNQPGDFELCMSMNIGLLDIFKKNYYLYISSSDHLMIIETIQVDTDVEEGNFMIIKGRSLESILNRRIVWQQTIFDGNLQNAVKKLISEAIISPSDSNRMISNFIFQDSTDPQITSLSLSAQYTGDDLLEVVQNICDEANIGFRITLNSSNQFVFNLYTGVDRTYDQNDRPYVVFSTDFDNLINTNWITSYENLKTITLVAGEGEGSDRKTTTVGDSSVTGLNRRELFTDARDISSDNGAISDADYYAQLQKRGAEKLQENDNRAIDTFEGSIDHNGVFKYHDDFEIGDIVQFKNEYGIEGKVRIIEYIVSDDREGYQEYPTFEVIEED